MLRSYEVAHQAWINDDLGFRLTGGDGVRLKHGEALALYKRVQNACDSFASEPPVSRSTRDQTARPLTESHLAKRDFLIFALVRRRTHSRPGQQPPFGKPGVPGSICQKSGLSAFGTSESLLL